MGTTNYAVLLCCGNDEPVTMYEGASFTAARLTFKSLDNAAGKSPNLSILEMSRAWDLLYNIKLVRIRQNGDGCTPEMDVIYLSDYYFISEP